MSVHSPIQDRFSEVLSTCRQFLLSIANDEMPDQLRAKGGASDLVQETLAAAHLARTQFRGKTLAELRSWLRSILMNELAMFRRRYLATGQRDVTREVAISLDCLDPRPTPISELSSRERDVQLEAAVDQLPEPYRETVLLRVEWELSFEEIGQRTDRSAEAARKVFSRALDMLRQTAPELGEEMP